MNERKILPVKSVVIFRMFFADERNVDLLTGFLKSVLRLPEDEYSEIVIADPYLVPEYAGDKLAIIDVKLHTKSHKIIHIEIQPLLQKKSQFALEPHEAPWQNSAPALGLCFW